MASREQILARFNDVRVKAADEWGAFRRMISTHPLKGFWCGVALGAALGYAGSFIL